VITNEIGLLGSSLVQNVIEIFAARPCPIDGSQQRPIAKSDKTPRIVKQSRTDYGLVHLHPASIPLRLFLPEHAANSSTEYHSNVSPQQTIDEGPLSTWTHNALAWTAFAISKTIVNKTILQP
jgi:hypothetical protein